MHTCMRTQTLAHTHTHTHTTHVYTHAYTHMHICICTRAHTHIHTHTHTHTYTHTHTCTHTHTHTHTYTHMHMCAQADMHDRASNPNSTEGTAKSASGPAVGTGSLFGGDDDGRREALVLLWAMVSTHTHTHTHTHSHTDTHTHICISTHKAHTSCQFTAQKASPTFQHRLRCFPLLVPSIVLF